MTEQNGHTPPAPLTPAAEFRRMREQGETVTIAPTGRRVRMRTVKPATLLREGHIPDMLAELVIGILYGKITEEQYQAFFSLNERKEHALELAESLRVVCAAALLEPRVVEDPQADDEIHIDDLEQGEQRFIFDLAFLEASGLRRFRHLQETDVEPVAQEPEPELPAEPVDGN